MDHGHGHGHEFPLVDSGQPITHEDMERAVAQVTAVRQEIEGYQIRMECARIAVQAEGSVGVREVVTLARQIYEFVREEPAPLARQPE